CAENAPRSRQEHGNIVFPTNGAMLLRGQAVSRHTNRTVPVKEAVIPMPDFSNAMLRVPHRLRGANAVPDIKVLRNEAIGRNLSSLPVTGINRRTNRAASVRFARKPLQIQVREVVGHPLVFRVGTLSAPVRPFAASAVQDIRVHRKEVLNRAPAFRHGMPADRNTNRAVPAREAVIRPHGFRNAPVADLMHHLAIEPGPADYCMI
ncbi:MAG: hypothetical protein WCG51_03645, partial [Elusimicrobiota bacterium]